MYTDDNNTLQLSEMLFRKADKFCGPAGTWTIQNSLDNADASRPLTQDCPALLIDSPTGHYTNTGSGTHNSSLFAIVQQGRALEPAFIVPNGMSMHCHAHWKYTRSLQSTDTSLLGTL